MSSFPASVARRIGLLAVVVIALAGFVAAGLGVGWISKDIGDDELDWEVAALAFTGFATLGLAFATFVLATQTRRDVDASTLTATAAQRSADVSAASFAASIRPILADSPGHQPRVDRQSYEGKDVVRLTAPLRNVGSGLAVLEAPRLLTTIRSGATMRTVTAGGLALPVGERVFLEFDVLHEAASEAQAFEEDTVSNGFEIEVRYRDFNGEQLSRTTARAAYRPIGPGWEYAEIALYRGDETTPFATLPRSVTIAPPAAGSAPG